MSAVDTAIQIGLWAAESAVPFAPTASYVLLRRNEKKPVINKELAAIALLDTARVVVPVLLYLADSKGFSVYEALGINCVLGFFATWMFSLTAGD